MQFNGQRLLVIGGSRGVGRAIAIEGAKRGADVVILYRSRMEEAEAVLTAIRAEGRNACSVRADLADPVQTRSAVNAAAEALGGISLLAHAAGAMGQWASVAEMHDDEWQRYISVDLNGCFFALSAAIPHLRKAGGGAILVISSIAAQMCQARNAQGAAAKAGVEALIRVTAKEEARHGIRANALAIGLTATDMAQTAFDAWGPETSARIVKGIPLGRIATPEEVAGVACFMLSKECSYLTGKVLQLDGGQIISG